VWSLDLYSVREWDGSNRDFFSLGWETRNDPEKRGVGGGKGLVLGQIVGT